MLWLHRLGTTQGGTFQHRSSYGGTLLGNSAHVSDHVCALSRLQFERNSYLGVSCYIFLLVLAEML